MSDGLHADDDLRRQLAGVVLSELRAGPETLSPAALTALRILEAEPPRQVAAADPPRPPIARPARRVRRVRVALALGTAATVIAGGIALAGLTDGPRSTPADARPAPAAPSASHAVPAPEPDAAPEHPTVAGDTRTQQQTPDRASGRAPVATRSPHRAPSVPGTMAGTGPSTPSVAEAPAPPTDAPVTLTPETPTPEPTTPEPTTPEPSTTEPSASEPVPSSPTEPQTGPLPQPDEGGAPGG